MVPNYVAGALIGKGGTVVKEMNKMYGGFLRISSGGEYYPGTEERIVVIEGEKNQVKDMNNHIMLTLDEPGRDSTMKEVPIDEFRASMVKIVLTDGAAGLLIGKGGKTIASIQDESKAKVSVAMPERPLVPGERMLTIRGKLEERTKACNAVIDLIAEDPSNMANNKTKYDILPPVQMSLNNTYSSLGRRPFESRGFNDDMSSRSSSRGSRGGGRDLIKLPVKVTADVMVPVQLVGAVLGKQGSVIKDIVHRSGGARLRFAEPKDADDDDQKLTITGSFDQVQVAYAYVNDRVNNA